MGPNTATLLIGESFSPWTKKSRWALEQCGVNYTYQEYTPTLSEPGLRWRMRQWAGQVSVPVMFIDGQILRGSWEIAGYANNKSGKQPLGNFESIKLWDEVSEDALAQGRTSVVRCILNSNEALAESLPTWVPTQLRAPLRFIARNAVQRLDNKYAHLVQPEALRDALLRLRSELANSESGYLLDQFSYADITMAVILELIAPIAKLHQPLGPATQRCWHNPKLAAEFPDLLAWRDQLASTSATTYSQFK